MITVVGGAARKSGKTSVVAGIISALPEFAWTAIKISAHEHGAGWGVAEERLPSGTDTGRYLAAGARRAFWIRASGEGLWSAAEHIGRLASAGEPTIVESTSILRYLQADLAMLVLGACDAPAKESARAARSRVDAVILTRADSLPPAGQARCFRVTPPQYVTPAIAAFVRGKLSAASAS
jgi:molybdopterin-guanine dinucleotide biosynthesis protein